MISQLKSLGLKLQLDQFGADCASSTEAFHLENVLYKQFDSLKISQSLLEDVNANKELLQSISQAANMLGIDMIAVGVETLAQSLQLKEINCKYGQGYLFAKPAAC